MTSTDEARMAMATPRIRSMLFVPGNKPAWAMKAPGYGPDALLLDLEDSVPTEGKAQARVDVGGVIDELRHSAVSLFVRVNGWRTGEMLDDVSSVVRAGLDGIMLPKLKLPAEVVALDLVLTELELTRDLPVGAIEIMPSAETAYGMLHSYEAITSSARVRRGGVLGATPRGGYYRALGSRFRPDGLETLFSSCKNVMEARAAGIESILCGTVSDLSDHEYTREVMVRARDLGANGALLIHPDQIKIAHDVYSPSAEEIREARELLAAFASALEAGNAAVRHDGHMVDYAHIRTSLDLLKDAHACGLEVGDVPSLDVLAYEP